MDGWLWIKSKDQDHVFHYSLSIRLLVSLFLFIIIIIIRLSIKIASFFRRFKTTNDGTDSVRLEMMNGSGGRMIQWVCPYQFSWSMSNIECIEWTQRGLWCGNIEYVLVVSYLATCPKSLWLPSSSNLSSDWTGRVHLKKIEWMVEWTWTYRTNIRSGNVSLNYKCQFNQMN